MSWDYWVISDCEFNGKEEERSKTTTTKSQREGFEGC